VAEVLAVRDLNFRLYRRVVEIRDGGLALRPCMDPAIADEARRLCRAAGLSEHERQAVVEAASLAAAMRATRQGTRGVSGPSSAGMSGGADLPSEIAVLERVAHHYTHSPIVRTIVASVEHGRDVATTTDRRTKRP